MYKFWWHARLLFEPLGEVLRACVRWKWEKKLALSTRPDENLSSTSSPENEYVAGVRSIIAKLHDLPFINGFLEMELR